MSDIGHVDYLRSKRDAGLACVKSPRDRARILGINSAPQIISSPTVAAPRIFEPLPAPATPIMTLPPRAEVVVRVQPLAQQRDVGISVSIILAVVAAAFEVTVDEMKGHGRARRFSNPRHAAYKIIRDRMNYSTSIVGRLIGYRDHTTILAGVRRCEIHQMNPDWRARYDRALSLLDKPLPATGLSPVDGRRAPVPNPPHGTGATHSRSGSP